MAPINLLHGVQFTTQLAYMTPVHSYRMPGIHLLISSSCHPLLSAAPLHDYDVIRSCVIRASSAAPLHACVVKGSVQEMWAGREDGDVHTDRGGDEGRDLSRDHEQLFDDGRSAELVSQGAHACGRPLRYSHWFICCYNNPTGEWVAPGFRF